MLCPENPLNSFDVYSEKCANCEYYYDCQLKEKNNDNRIVSESTQYKCAFYPNIFFAKGKCKICHYYSQCLKKFYPEENDPKKNKNPITQEEFDNFLIDLGNIVYFCDWEKRVNENQQT